MEKVIGIEKIENPEAVLEFGKYARQLYKILVERDGITKALKCYLDEEKMLKYVEGHRQYLNMQKTEIIGDKYKKTMKQRLKNNLTISPAYVIAILTFIFGPSLANAIGGMITQEILSQIVLHISLYVIPILGIGVGALAGYTANRNELYINPSDLEKINLLSDNIKDLNDFQQEVEFAISKSSEYAHERSKIQHEKWKKRNELESRAKQEQLDKTINETRERIRERMYGPRKEIEVPEFLKKRR